MKHWKRLSLLTVAVLAAALAARMMTPLPNSGQEVVFRSGNITVTR